ncbi:MAG: indole-3-glycerol phosphate synthase TrpC [Lachnospiraceae bacterium]|nr:indole-3-glycerol phosphate synthase TrpC [Lachnospiraceae bacterium]
MILDDIVADKRMRLFEHKKKISEEEMKKLALESERKSISFYEALKKDGLSIIGEFKKASPSMGVIDGKIELTDRIEQYNESVDAISVLTEEDHFNGNVDYLKKVRGISDLPIIRKDFIIDEYQVYEAKVIGADCVLLIAAILTDGEMKKLYDLAYSLGMDVLLEVHDETEMKRAVNLEAKIIGVNNRNLKNFTIDLKNAEKLSRYMDGILKEREIKNRPVFVSESGVTTDEDIAFLKKCNVDALLIGRAFMESEKPRELAKKWKGIFDGN